MKLNLLTFLGLLLFFSSCTKDKLYVASESDNRLEYVIKRASIDKTLDHFILPESTDYTEIPQDVHNPLTAEKIALGKLLFFETGLALNPVKNVSKGTWSCSTCHIPSADFRPGNMQGIADGGIGIGNNGEGRTKRINYKSDELDAQGVRPLTVLNVAYVTNTLWNGQFGANGINVDTEYAWDQNPLLEVNHLGLEGLESQNIEGLDLHRMVVNETVIDTLGYKDMYDAAFPDFSENERYGKMTTSFALSAYLRALLTTEAPFQKWLKGDKASMTDEQKRGAILFFDKAKCYLCHTGKSLNAMQFYAVGVKDLFHMGGLNTAENDKRNLGRGSFTGKEEDMYKFKVPQLYNLKGTPFYFHGSSKRSIREVVEYFNEATPENPNVPNSQIATVFNSLDLTENEITDLVAFLEDGLYDSELDRYVPERTLSGNCFPNNDLLSKYELGCD